VPRVEHALKAGGDVTAASEATRAKLRAAALDTLRTDGIAGLSARTVAGRAGVNQALIFYHFGTLAALVDVAAREAVDASIATYRDDFAAVRTFAALLALGRVLHERERAAGNVAVMAQLMAAGPRDDQLAESARYAMARWHREVEDVARRVLRDSPLALAVEPAGVAHAIVSGFIGVELYEGIDPAAAGQALDALERLGALVEMLDDLGPVAGRALRTTLRRRGLATPRSET
jgi:AcrR family transcriptional regulator